MLGWMVLATSAPSSTFQAKISVTDGHPAAIVSEAFLGVNLDWWLEGCGGEGAQWDLNASAARIDLTNPRLRALAAGLAGGTLRVGGTHGNSVVYVTGNSTAALSCATHGQQRCYPICLTVDRFAAITDFAERSGLALAFGLNMQVPDVTNIKALFAAVASRNLTVDAWELGNELGLGPVEDLGPAVAAARDVAWPLGSPNRPVLVGVDDAGDGSNDRHNTNNTEPEARTLVREQSFLHAITFHAYPLHHGGGPTPTLLEHMMNFTVLDIEIDAVFGDMVTTVADATAARGRGNTYYPEVWMGEGNAAGHGGRPGATNAFANSFWYLHAMGTAARLGISRFCRQTLVGGGYELLNRSSWDPNPDYFAALLWARTAGTHALNVTVTTGDRYGRDTFRAHAMCAKSDGGASFDRGTGWVAGDILVIALNAGRNETVEVSLDAPGADSVLLWLVRTVIPGDITSSRVALKNDAEVWSPLAVDHQSNELPKVQYSFPLS